MTGKKRAAPAPEAQGAGKTINASDQELLIREIDAIGLSLIRDEDGSPVSRANDEICRYSFRKAADGRAIHL